MTPLELFEQIGSSHPGSSLSQMFGKPCFKYQKKAFCCFFEDSMVFKLRDQNHHEALSLSNAELFDPSKKGRAMKEWVQVPFEQSQHWQKFSEVAYNYLHDVLG